MSEEYCAIKWLDDNTVIRKTREVNLKCGIINFIMDYPNRKEGWTIKLTGTADLEHHLIEDSAILLKKMAEVKCGSGH